MTQLSAVEVASLLHENERQHRELVRLQERYRVSQRKIETARYVIKSHFKHQLADAETTMKAIDRALQGEGNGRY